MAKKAPKKPRRIRVTDQVTTPSGDTLTLAVACEPITREVSNA